MSLAMNINRWLAWCKSEHVSFPPSGECAVAVTAAPVTNSIWMMRVMRVQWDR